MSKTSNSPTAIRVHKKRFDTTEIRNLTLDEVQFVTGGLTFAKPIFTYTKQKPDGTSLG